MEAERCFLNVVPERCWRAVSITGRIAGIHREALKPIEADAVLVFGGANPLPKGGATLSIDRLLQITFSFLHPTGMGPFNHNGRDTNV